MKKLLALVAVYGLPALALAADVNLADKGVEGGLKSLINIINNTLIPLLVAIAVLVFLYGLVTYILNAGDEEKQKASKWYVIYGIVGIFIMISVWGLVNLLRNTFNLDTNRPPFPNVPGGTVAP